jgi:hypothetical protein
MHARGYSATNARFLSLDRIDGNFGDPQTWNRYSYVKNTPVIGSDPDGLSFWIIDEQGHPWLTDELITVNGSGPFEGWFGGSDSPRGYTRFMRGYNGYNVWQHFGAYLYYHPTDAAAEVSGVFIITDLRYVKAAARVLPGNVTEGGGVEAARAQFERLTGRPPKGGEDIQRLPDGSTVKFRESGESGAKVELNDPNNLTYQKTTFREP